MPTIVSQLETAFKTAIHTALGIDADPLLNVSQNEKFGDYQSNAAMGLAKKLPEAGNPRQIAEKIKAKLELGDLAGEVSIAGPGFINVRLNPVWLGQQVRKVALDPRRGVEKSAKPIKIVIDYSGPNLAKEMHVGHLRGTIIGDSFARVLEFLGHTVIRQNHIGDWGLQMGMVTFALEQEGLATASLSLRDLGNMYKRISAASKEPVMRKQMAERTRDLQQTPKDQLTGWKQVRDLTLVEAHDLYGQLNVTLTDADVRGESAYSDDYAPMVEMLRVRGLAKETEGAIGIFPTGFVNREGEPRPFIIQSRDGSYQYPTFDLAALTYRINVLRADRVIYTHDSRQAEHFDMLFAVAKQVGLLDNREVLLEFAPFGNVLGEDGKPMKSREADNQKLKDLLSEGEERAYAVIVEKNPELPEQQRRDVARAVGIGAVKYADLSKDRTSDYIFAWDKMLSFDGNTGPYLQFAYARIQSIFRRAAERGVPVVRPFTGELKLESPYELALAKHVLRFADVVEIVARELKPHHLSGYLYDLATKYSGFFENCPVLQSEEPVRSSRLTLCEAVGVTMGLGLELLGIEHPDQM
jgi:arginyl-tRNA synthetase